MFNLLPDLRGQLRATDQRFVLAIKSVDGFYPAFVYIDCIAEKKDVTVRYKSVMGKASVRFLEGEEKQQAIDAIIMARHEKTRNFEYNRAAVQRTAVGKLTVIEMTAKENPIRGGADI